MACPVPLSDCTFTDPNTQVTYDFRPIQNMGILQATDGTGYNYKFQMCGIVNETSCAEVSGGLCQYSKSTLVASLGSFETSPAPTWTALPEGVLITIQNGGLCWYLGERVPRTTLITTACGSGSTSYTVLEGPPCTYNILLTSPFACTAPFVPNCQADFNTTATATATTITRTTTNTSRKYDLSGLHILGDFSVSNSGTNYLFNVCGGVTSNAICLTGNGAACQFSPSATHILARSATPLPVWTEISQGGGVIITYHNGDICYPASQPRQTIYTVQCDPTVVMSSLTVQEPQTCVYLFTFNSKYACPL